METLTETAQTEIDALEAGQTALETGQATIQGEIEALRTADQTISETVTALQSTIDTLTTQGATAEEQIAALQSSTALTPLLENHSWNYTARNTLDKLPVGRSNLENHTLIIVTVQTGQGGNKFAIFSFAQWDALTGVARYAATTGSNVTISVGEALGSGGTLGQVHIGKKENTRGNVLYGSGHSGNTTVSIYGVL